MPCTSKTHGQQAPTCYELTLSVLLFRTFLKNRTPNCILASISILAYSKLLDMKGLIMKTDCRYYMAMILVNVVYGVSNILVKIALAKGLHQLILVLYRHLLALLLLAPFAYVLERKQRPSISFSLMIKIFVLSSLGTTVYLNVYYAGLAYTSPTVGCALNNVVPCSTFLIALLLRMEKVNIRSSRGRAKVVGTFICIVGSLVFTFWKGGFQLKGLSKRPLIDIYDARGSHGALKHGKQNWLKGTVLILTSNFAWSGWLILQAVVLKMYPARLSLNVWICFFASLQSAFLALFHGRDPTIWKLGWNVQLLTIIFGGVVLSGGVNWIQIWCISNKGPVFVAMFSPLQLVVSGIFSAVAFQERLHLGSLIGSFLIIVGLYLVLWGKSKDNLVEVQQEGAKGADKDDKMLEIHADGHLAKNAAASESQIGAL